MKQFAIRIGSFSDIRDFVSLAIAQPFEVLVSSTGHETYCIYSVGNALSNQRRENISQTPEGHCEDSMIFGVTFEKWNDGSVNIAEIDILPVWVSRDRNNAKGSVYHIIPLDLAVEDWTVYNEVSSVASKYLEGSYKRIMSVVGEGLNECRLELGLPEVPMTADDK
jgi:poly-gamma-glutamate synthesis protein (capsule biosynthesis protein)